MTGNQPDTALLDEARADFITHHVAMNVASCSAALLNAVPFSLSKKPAADTSA
jgi:hypothetical protein